MSDVRKLIGEALSEIIDSAAHGGPRVRVGLQANGSEHGPEEIVRAARLAQSQNPNIQVVLIGPRKVENCADLEWIETGECENELEAAMDEAMNSGKVAGIVAMHHPFPMGVTTIGRVFTPAFGRDMIVASTTGTSAINRVEAMIRNTVYGLAVAKALGKANPTVGILNVEGAQMVYKALCKLKDNGYPITFGQSRRADGGSVLRGNDILQGVVDVCVCDTLTGNVLMKMFSSFNTGGSYEALGWGYGPSVGEGWDHVVNIISRASGAPVIANAVAYCGAVAAGKLPEIAAAEIDCAKACGLEKIIADSLPAPASASAEDVKVPPAEPTNEEIHGVDVLAIEDAVRELWKHNIYAESSMGCTGPVVKLNKAIEEEARKILGAAGYL
ncbi:MAG: glycine reductase [Pyramidobacter sp.]|nr:glycine reductase [Pyramidobacter sp.]